MTVFPLFGEPQTAINLPIAVHLVVYVVVVDVAVYDVVGALYDIVASSFVFRLLRIVFILFILFDRQEIFVLHIEELLGVLGSAAVNEGVRLATRHCKRAAGFVNAVLRKISANRNILDNAGMMCLNFFNQIGVKHIYLAGFDGFRVEHSNNYYNSSMVVQVESERLIQMNDAITEKIKQMRRQMRIEFLTDSLYDC